MAPHRSTSFTPASPRTAQRDRALARLTRLTTATAVAGTFATVGFGGLAAVTFSGTTQAAVDDPQADVLRTTVDGSAAGQSAASGSDDESGSEADSNTLATPRPQATTTTRTPTYTYVQPPVRTTGRSHVSSGGSG